LETGGGSQDIGSGEDIRRKSTPGESGVRLGGVDGCRVLSSREGEAEGEEAVEIGCWKGGTI